VQTRGRAGTGHAGMRAMAQAQPHLCTGAHILNPTGTRLARSVCGRGRGCTPQRRRSPHPRPQPRWSSCPRSSGCDRGLVPARWTRSARCRRAVSPKPGSGPCSVKRRAGHLGPRRSRQTCDAPLSGASGLPCRIRSRR
jgi:hypothetical protein